MRTRILSVALAASLFVGLTGCGGGGGGGGDNGLSSGSTALAMGGEFPTSFTSIGDLVLFLVDEVENGESDLNGDGDIADDVVHVLDPQSGTVTNLGWACNGVLAGSATLGYFIVPENAQGAMDLNGNGDFNDYLLAVYDPALPVSPTNPSLSLVPVVEDAFIVSDGIFTVSVTSEASLGVDSNLDGDLDDEYILTYDTINQTYFMTPFASVTGAPFQFANGVVAFTVDETNHGSDVNGNATITDVLLFTMNPDGSMLSLVGPGPGRLVHPLGFAIAGTPVQPRVVFSIDEAAEGINLNGSGLVPDVDTSDFVCAVWDVNAGTEAIPGGGLGVQPTRYSVSATRFACAVIEAENGPSGTDLNSDFDATDIIPFWVDLANPTSAENVGVAQDADENSFFPFLCDEFLVVMAIESMQGPGGTNYNSVWGDSDTEDQVPFFLDIRSPNVNAVNLEVACTEFICSGGVDRWIILVGDEAANNDADLNGYSPGTDLAPGYIAVNPDNTLVFPTRYYRVDGNISMQECADSLRFVAFSQEGKVPEYWRLNSDDDIDDWGVVVTRISKANGEVLDVSRAGMVNADVGMSSFPLIINQTSVVFPADELIFGTGINGNPGSGDTDLADMILDYAAFTCP